MVTEGLTANAGWDLIKLLSSYFGLRDYVTFLFTEQFYPNRIKQIHSYPMGMRFSGEELFWREVLVGHLPPGSMLKLYDFQISPWFPRKPGMYWTYDAAIARHDAMQRHVEKIERELIVFDVYGKALMAELGGIGSVNFRKNRGNVLATATASGYTDRGIPLICSENVWQEINNALKKEKKIEVDLKGIVEAIPTQYDSFFLRSPGLPKVAVRITSILNIKIKASRLGIVVSPWTMFETSDPECPYGLTYVTHELFKDEINESVKWMLDYIDHKNGKTILTDFDEETHLLNARFPLSNCADGSVLNDDILRYYQTIWRKFHKHGKLDVFRGFFDNRHS